ncbi:MAG: fused FliR family export protein/FlhB family type III secretion system protein [Clostridiaceae bacterium]
MIDTSYFLALILVFLRIITFTALVPIFFPTGTPNQVKVGFSLIIAYILVPSIDIQTLNQINNIYYFAFQCIAEVTTGLTLGFTVNLVFLSARYAGNILDMIIGFSMMSFYDPSSSSNTTLIERLFYYTSLVLFLVLDAHHILIRALVDSFTKVSIGKFIFNENTFSVVMENFINFFSIGLRIAIPIVFVILIADMVFGLVARSVPQINIMILGLPLKIIIGLSAIFLSVPIIINLIENSFNSVPDLFNNFYKIIPVILIFDAEDKTEDPTPRKKRESKEKGQVAKSKELSLSLTLIAITLSFLVFGNFAFEQLGRLMTYFLGSELISTVNYLSLKNIVVTVLLRFAIIIFPFVLPIMIVGVLSNFLQTGFILTGDPLKPDIKKLNPISGFKKIFSMRSLVDLVKNTVIVFVLAYVGYLFVKDNYNIILNTGNLKFSLMAGVLKKYIINIFFRIILVTFAISLLDFIYQRYQHNKDLKMSKQEVKEEYKQEEGDPQIKSRVRQIQRDMARKRMMQSVPDATVVITNPTHLAIVLKYDEDKDKAPIVTAKGADNIATKIKELALDNDIPIIENKPLARLIYKEVEIDQEIPADMYGKVAEILAIVYKIKRK